MVASLCRELVVADCGWQFSRGEVSDWLARCVSLNMPHFFQTAGDKNEKYHQS
jgi:hypothetical protein